MNESGYSYYCNWIAISYISLISQISMTMIHLNQIANYFKSYEKNIFETPLIFKLRQYTKKIFKWKNKKNSKEIKSNLKPKNYWCNTSGILSDPIFYYFGLFMFTHTVRLQTRHHFFMKNATTFELLVQFCSFFPDH